jgi:hypothetical protein
MTRSKPSSRNSVKSALLFFSFFLYTVLSGCQNSTEPSFQEKDIPYHVKKICKEDYRLDVITVRTNTTLWIYAPLEKILDKEYGIKEGKVLDEEMTDKLRNILITVGRVVLSSNKAPEFFAIWSSDINLGLDYILIGNVIDIKKAYAESIPFTESNKRYVMRFGLNPEAIHDTAGRHLKFYNVNMPDFLTQQMAQRISMRFQADNLKQYFKLDKIDGIFNNDTFILEYTIKPLTPSQKPIDIMDEILNTITYCIKAYDFKNFSRVEITNLNTKFKTVLSKADILARSVPNDY